MNLSVDPSPRQTFSGLPVPAWVLSWVALVMESLAAVTSVFTRVPRVQVLVQDWLTKYAKWAGEECFYIIQLARQNATQLFPTEPVLIIGRSTVQAIIQTGREEMMVLLRTYGISPLQATQILDDLEIRVYSDLLSRIESTPIPAAGANILRTMTRPAQLPMWVWFEEF